MIQIWSLLYVHRIHSLLPLDVQPGHDVLQDVRPGVAKEEVPGDPAPLHPADPLHGGVVGVVVDQAAEHPRRLALLSLIENKT